MNPVLPNLGAYTLQVTLLLGIALPLPHILRLSHPKLRLRYWQTLLVLILIVPFLQPWQPTPTIASSALSLDLESWVGSGGPESNLPFSPLFAFIAVGIVGRLVWLALGLFSLQRWRRTAQASELIPAELRDLHQQLAPEANILFSRHVETPLTFGRIHPTILLPDEFQDLSSDQQRGIICHELLHVRRGDWLITLSEEILRSLLWFHPGVWILLARINLSREQLVDQEVVQITQEPLAYLRALLNIAQGPEPSTPAAAFLRRSHLFHRIALLTQKSRPSEQYRTVKVATLLSALALTSAVGASVFPFLANSSTQESLPRPGTDSTVLTQETTPQPLTVTDGIMKPKVIDRVQPIYPEDARKDQLEGKVIVQVTIDTRGRVTDDQLLLSLRDDLDQAALKAIRQWRFEPATLHGQPVTVYYNLVINYALQ